MILSIDQSTSATKGLLFDLQGRLLARADIQHKQIINDDGWLEHDPDEIIRNVLECAERAIEEADIAASKIEIISISNQRETALCWDRVTGRPLYNAIVWQCGRATDIIDVIESSDMASIVKTRTGLDLSPFFSAAKWGWMIKHISSVSEAAKRGTLCCGTIDAWLLFKLTGEFKTDYSNASRTQLLNLDTLQWDLDLCDIFGVPINSLPEVCMSDSFFGTTYLGGLLPKPRPIHCVMGDSHAALFANRCTQMGMAKATYGTGSSIMMHMGENRPQQVHGAVISLAWGRNGKVEYVREGNINYAGAVTKWLVDDINLIDNPKEAGQIAQSVDDTNGIYLVPAFSGLGAPYFNTNVRAAIIGMNASTKKAHIVRAAEECIAYQISDVVDCIIYGDTPFLQVLCVDGGATKDSFLMQFQANLLGVPLKISSIAELSGAGVAYCAVVSAGLATEEKIFSNIEYKTVLPQMSKQERDKRMSGWRQAVKSVANLKMEG